MVNFRENFMNGGQWFLAQNPSSNFIHISIKTSEEHVDPIILFPLLMAGIVIGIFPNIIIKLAQFLP